ncbi:DUF2971 domain-containing protein [Streptococcus suis]|uniref:DUF2971 domain-containing protein n=1 Tax=Streptococcus sp. A23 TaxID=3373127 RepID=UPI001554B051|nr:DUF2971 domain-containing protein [Streptococcus suis]
MTKIYHYTSLDTLLYILKYKTLRFTSLGWVDDLYESKTSDYGFLAEYCYVSCWTKIQEESIPQWSMYSRDMTGIRIGIEFDSVEDIFDLIEYKFDDKEDKISSSLIPENMEIMGSNPPYKPIYKEVIYTDDESYLIPNVYSRYGYDEKNYEERVDFTQIGIFKPTAWDFQKETRFKVMLTPWTMKDHLEILDRRDMEAHLKMMSRAREEKPLLSHIDIKLNESIFEKLSVLTGPKCSDAQKEMLQMILDKYAPNVKYTESILQIQ